MKLFKPELIALLLLFLALSSCSHKISRIGYSEKPMNEIMTCDVYIQKEKNFSASEGDKIGTIKLNDTGFSTACNEQDAIQILKKEACSIGGNLVIIIEEKRPNIMSSCYQCTADIYKIGTDSLQVNTTPANHYDTDNLNDRINVDKKRNRTIFWSSFAVGFVIGFIIFL